MVTLYTLSEHYRCITIIGSQEILCYPQKIILNNMIWIILLGPTDTTKINLLAHPQGGPRFGGYVYVQPSRVTAESPAVPKIVTK